MAFSKLAALFLCIVAFTSALPTPDEARGNSVQTEHDLLDAVYNDCLKKDSISCFKYKVFNFVDKMLGNRETITVMDGVQFVKTSGGEQDGAPRAISSDDTIESVIFSRVASFLGSHSLKIDLKGSEVINAVQSTARSFNEYAESLEEEENLIEGAGESRKKKGGGGKKGKGNIGAIMGLFALKAAILGKLALAAIALIAGKALIIGKIALVLSAIIGLKKLLGSGGGGGSGKHVTYEVVPHASHSSAHIATHDTSYGGSGHGGGYGGDVGGGSYGGSSGGWGRSLDAQSLAYRGHLQAKQT